jgi:hypothetical protein
MEQRGHEVEEADSSTVNMVFDVMWFLAYPIKKIRRDLKFQEKFYLFF